MVLKVVGMSILMMLVVGNNIDACCVSVFVRGIGVVGDSGVGINIGGGGDVDGIVAI